MEDVVVVTRDIGRRQGRVEPVGEPDRAGAMGGGFWGTLIGMLFLNPLVGGRVGAAPGRCRASSPISGSTTIS